MKTITLSVFALCFALNSIGAEKVKAKIEANKKTGFLPLAVRFSCPEQSPDVAYYWDFGNGNTSMDRNPQSMFVNPGKFNVKLVVRNRFEVDSAAFTVDVLPNNELINNLMKMRAGIK
jgi:PKD repeat protein